MRQRARQAVAVHAIAFQRAIIGLVIAHDKIVLPCEHGQKRVCHARIACIEHTYMPRARRAAAKLWCECVHGDERGRGSLRLDPRRNGGVIGGGEGGAARGHVGRGQSCIGRYQRAVIKPHHLRGIVVTAVGIDHKPGEPRENGGRIQGLGQRQSGAPCADIIGDVPVHVLKVQSQIAAGNGKGHMVAGVIAQHKSGRLRIIVENLVRFDAHCPASALIFVLGHRNPPTRTFWAIGHYPGHTIMSLRRQRSVKIVATLGPASSDYDTIRALFEAGADVFRLNMSHGTHEEMKERYDIIRMIEGELDRPIGVLADLQGPKLRVGTFANGSEELEIGQAFRLDLDESPGDKARAHLPHPEIFKALTKGATLLVNDGKIRLTVTDCGDDFAQTEVVAGGTISDRKGVNVPDVVLPLAALTEKDRVDLEFACNLGADWIALSFVQRADDVEEARALVAGRAAVMVKVEKPSAVTSFDQILLASDGIMVARGDLGVEMDIQDVPPIQKRLIRSCRQAGKPVIVATQMLESMIQAPIPTRAEVSDVAHAIYEGADAVMLSAESAAGEHPIASVKMMNAVAESVDRDPTFRQIIDASRVPSSEKTAGAMTGAAREIAETIDVKAIATFTHSGTTALLVSRERPRVPILALTPFFGTARRLAMVWGLHCVVTANVERFKFAVVSAARAARVEGFATEEDKIIVMAGIPFGKPGTTNILRVAPVNEKAIFEGEPE